MRGQFRKTSFAGDHIEVPKAGVKLMDLYTKIVNNVLSDVFINPTKLRPSYLVLANRDKNSGNLLKSI